MGEKFWNERSLQGKTWEDFRAEVRADIKEIYYWRLSRIPYRMIEETDLAAICYLPGKDGNVRLISEKFLESAGINEQELFTAALENAQEQKPMILKFTNNYPEDSKLEEVQEGEHYEEGSLYLLTNRGMTDGTAAILDRRKLEQAAALFEGNFCLIPTSRREWRMEPAGCNLEERRRGLDHLNKYLNSAWEKVSDKIYQFDARTLRLSIVPDRYLIERQSWKPEQGQEGDDEEGVRE